MTLLPMLPRLFGAALTSLMIISNVRPAIAQLTLCNGTSEELSVAIGYSERDQWYARGWWRLAPGECSTALNGRLPNRYYYYYAESVTGQVWGGDHSFCLDTIQAFTWRQGRCSSDDQTRGSHKSISATRPATYCLSSKQGAHR
jgi:uncharacterized membrane protein